MEDKTKQFNFRALGQAIKTARKGKGRKQEDLADKLSITLRYLVDIENETAPKSASASISIFCNP